MASTSKALEKYYSHKGNRIIFKDTHSLSGLALLMWAELGFKEVDASVLSRILKGERLFTAAQLRAFCKVLQLSKREEEDLFLCLEQDRSQELNRYVALTRISSSLATEIAAEFAKNGFDMFYRAEYDAMPKRWELSQRLADAYAVANDHKSLDVILAANLYLKGRIILNTSAASQVLRTIRPMFSRLLAMSQESQSSKLYGYAYALLSDAYYIAGCRSDLPSKRRLYITSIRHAQIAINNLCNDDREYLYALRTMVASAHYAHDEQAVHHLAKLAEHVMPMQPSENYINALHLALTLDKAWAAIHERSPCFTQKITAKYFQRRDLTHTGLYEISGIREEVDTLLFLKVRDRDYIEKRLRLAVQVASHYKFSRHKQHLNRMIREVQKQ